MMGMFYARTLSTTASTYELKAGKRTITGSGTILQGNVTSNWTIDGFVRVGYEITNNGATVNMYLQLNGSGMLSAAHIFYNQNQTNINRVLDSITASSTNFIIDATSTNQERAFIDTTIHSTGDGSGDWKYKYKGRFTHHGNNNMYWCLEAEYNPRHTV